MTASLINGFVPVENLLSVSRRCLNDSLAILGSNPGVKVLQISGRPSKVNVFPRVVQFPPPCVTTERQHLLNVHGK